MPKIPDLREYIRAHIQAGTAEECWYWTKYIRTSGNGYGDPVLQYAGEDYRVRHMLLALLIDIDPQQQPPAVLRLLANKHIIMSCNEPACVNPNHMYLSTGSSPADISVSEALINRLMRLKDMDIEDAPASWRDGAVEWEDVVWLLERLKEQTTQARYAQAGNPGLRIKNTNEATSERGHK